MARHLIGLGDSHLEALQFAASLGLLNVESSDFSIVPGATVVGLRNPNSLTNAVNLFKESLSACTRDASVVIHLGEVDCGFVMWWRAMKVGESVEAQFDQSLQAYRQFVNDVLQMGFSRICVTGASLPTIRDGVDMSEVANKRSEISVSLRDRTDLTLRYNRCLADMAADLKLGYFDVGNATLDRSSLLVHDFFRNHDPTDHHLDKTKVAGIWAERCNAFVGGSM
ncbi:hypothetical protein EN871_15030 [bacterium M00.F.Ca.ET.228.01.1.1]|uniref:hypothetical protein n=1 Tax=Paraburkholderia phenoliruptrix TaxID=252970 RepID=UPI0010921D57|nr:hypothetical protein [Paraburkholderia phenoliruptrix]TGP43138.1 hypothetical protein EN871_15030 [bacterium M00.F.Ca.ET.228.01.1.1]TGS00576.1 hypothetical protein EN834_15025 [bacterium M00.F.Ca.ET.191.01.1.1]TGU04962.1 hypothetical protein EN798_15845 [bacterium M00.F.Ca.ET.155.01.1.1]MBW0446930.1 hypothetical protein [Paraburkholderia phenoliruptrix]MBW9099426.1 hypothetical protein [Paraburkholderia phenoliruptrix]